MTTLATDAVSLDDMINPESDSDFSADSTLMQDYRYDSNGKVIEYKSYRTVLSLPSRLAAKKPAVRISADEDTSLHIAGTDYAVGPDKWQSFSFDATGELTMSVAATALHTPSLRINMAPMAASDFLVYAPDTDLHATLANLQAADLTSGTNPILSADQHDHAEGIALAVRQVAGLATSSADTTGAQAFGLLSKIKKGVSKATSSVTKEATQVTKEATTAVAKEATQVVSSASKVADTAFHDAAKGVDFVAKRGALKDGFAAASGTLSFMAKEGGKIVKKAIDFAVTTRKEAWELVHKIFSALAVGLDKVIAWLAKTFGWDDILYTKRTFEKAVLAGLRGIKEGSSGLSKKLTKKIDALRGKADSIFDGVIAKLGSQTVAGDKKVSVSNGDAHSLWLHHKLKDHGSKMTMDKVTDTSATSSGSHDRIKTFLTKLENTLVGKNASAEYGKSLALIKKELANPANLPEIAGQVILLCLRAVTDVALGVVDVIIEGVLGLVSELVELLRLVLVSKIHIPFISDFYKMIAGDDLRLIDLICLVLASIVTPIYKAAHNGNAPYGAVAPLTKEAYSFADSGEDDAAAKRRKLNQEMVAIVIAFSMIFECWEDCMSMGATDEAQEGEAIPSWILLVIDLIIQVLLVSGDGGPGDNYPAFLSNFTDSADSAAENSIWLFEWVPIGYDIVSIAYSLYEGHGTQLMRSEGKWGPVVEFTFGVILILAAGGQLTERLITKSNTTYQAGLEFGFDLAEAVRHLGKLFLEGKDPVELGILLGIDIATCSTAAAILPFISG